MAGNPVESNLADMSYKIDGYYSAARKEMLVYIPECTRTILEFGCGVGGFSALVKEKLGTENWAVEIDTQAVAEARG